ncbi:hypothetical protein GQ42DRAFT_176412 [Ramicandelaber brevisporus]|nr:hypothetical protein GQ42DRAFT_176412 [Ramicandelaber brevisporus]
MPRIGPATGALGTLNRILTHNHNSNSIFYEKFFFNHLVHEVYSLYELGATSEELDRAAAKYTARLCPIPRPTNIPSPQDLTADFLGKFYPNGDYFGNFKHPIYANLRAGIQDYAKDKSFEEVLNAFLPAVLPGILGGAMHGLIHLGYGAEFYDKNALIQAFSYIPMAYYKGGEVLNDANWATASDSDKQRLHDIIGSISVQTPVDFSTLATRSEAIYREVDFLVEHHGSELKSYVSALDLSSADGGSPDYRAAIKEIAIAGVLGYAGPRLPATNEPVPHFFLAHALNGILSVKNLLPYINTDANKTHLVRLLWLGYLALFMARGGRDATFEHISEYVPTRTLKGLDVGKYLAIDINEDEFARWEPLLQVARHSQEVHVTKVLRTMLELEREYGPHVEECEHIWWKSALITADVAGKEGHWHFFRPQ